MGHSPLLWLMTYTTAFISIRNLVILNLLHCYVFIDAIGTSMEYIKDRKFVCNILLPIILTLGTTHGSPLSGKLWLTFASHS